MFRVIMLGLSSAERCLLTIPRKITIVNQSGDPVPSSLPHSPTALLFLGAAALHKAKSVKNYLTTKRQCQPSMALNFSP